jgi:hypothetical protein
VKVVASTFHPNASEELRNGEFLNWGFATNSLRTKPTGNKKEIHKINNIIILFTVCLFLQKENLQFLDATFHTRSD